jgi:hypothetical protein
VSRRRSTAAVTAVIVVIVAALATVAGPSPATAQTDTPPLRLVEQDTVLAPNGTLRVVLELAAGVPSDARLVTTVHARLGAPRTAVRAILDGEPAGTLLLSRTDRIATLNPVGNRITMTVPTVTERMDSVPGENVRLALPGMYPVQFALRGNGLNDQLRLSSFVVREPVRTAEVTPVPFALVVPVVAPPTLQADGSTAITDATRVRITELTRFLTAWPRAPIATSVAPELLEGLQRSSRPGDVEMVRTLAGALAGREVLSRPYVGMDPTATAASGMGPAFVDGLTAGEDALTRELGVRPVRATWITSAPLSAGAFSLLRSVGVRQVVMPGSLLADGADDSRLGTVAVADDPARVPALVVDERLRALTDPATDRVLAAQHLVSLLLASALEVGTDAVPAGAPVVLALGERWSPSLATLDQVLALLSTPALQRYVRTSGLDEAVKSAPAAVAPTGGPITRSMAPGTTDPTLGGIVEAVAAVEAHAAAATSVRADRPVDTARLRMVVSTDLSADQRTLLLEAVRRDAAARIAVLEPIPRRTVTVGGDTASLPITVRSNVPYPVRVRLRLESTRLSFPANDEVIEIDGQWQGRVPVEVRANGMAPVTVRFVTPVGDVEIERAQIEVRALGLSGLGVLLSVGAMLVLAAFWFQHHRSARRRAGTLVP